MRFFRPRYKSKHHPSLRWQLFGWAIVFGSLALGAYVKVKWNYWLVGQVAPGKSVHTIWEVRETTDKLNKAIGTPPSLPNFP